MSYKRRIKLTNEYEENFISDRQTWIDIAKGIGILAMVFGHNILALQPIIFAFHMPLFFVLAGYTIKKVDKEQIISAIIKDFKRLIIPCIVAQLIILLGNTIINHNDILHEIKRLIACLVWGNHNGTLFGLGLPSIGRIWFLPALFWSKLVYRLLMYLFDGMDRFMVILILSFVSMFMGMNGIILPQNFDMLFVCILFIEIGNIFKKIDLKSFDYWIYIALFAVWTYFSCSQGIWISMNMRMYPGYGLCIIVALAGCLCIFRFSMAIENINVSKILSFYGINSLVLLCIQSIAPNFYIGSTGYQKCLDMLVECLIVVFYVYIKKLFISILKRKA